MSDPSDTTDVTENQRILKSLWKPHVGQRAILDHNARFKVVACGRRWGKSEMAAHAALTAALENPGATVWWVAPSYHQANAYGFDKITPLLSPDVLAEPRKRSKPREIAINNGATLSFRSADREDSLRGGGVDDLVIDEGGSVPERAWIEELRPALSDTLGSLLAIGTPRGRNWFYRWYQRGQSADHANVASWQAPTYQNPHVPDSEIDAAREDMPERAFEQEYLAKFVDNAGGVFSGVRACVEDYDLPVAPTDTADGGYGIGVDFARTEDWTVVVALDAAGRVVSFDRLRGPSWTRIQRLIERVAGQYTPCRVAVDATRDNKIVQDLEDSGVRVDPVTFTTSRKKTLIENLITRIESEEITIPASESKLINELEMFEYERTETGNVRYHAPAGMHDDTVDALALAADTEPSETVTISDHDMSDLPV